MSDRRKEADEKMEKAIFISADCWLKVFDLLTLLWKLSIGMENQCKFRKFKCHANFIDQNAIAFLHRFRPIFAACPINLSIHTNNDRILDMIVRNIWPMLEKHIHVIELAGTFFNNLRKFVPSILNDCPSLRVFNPYFDGFFVKFPCDDSATAWDGQAVAKWLFTPLQNDVPKLFKCSLYGGNWPSNIESFKAAFANASSPVNFIVFISFRSSLFVDSVVPFVLTNGFTHEQLVLKRINDSCRFLLIRCAIARDESKWTKWEEEAIDWKFYDQWNQISILTFRETRGCPSRRKPCPK
ncbi:hypothetical protein niasHT_032927 [Heterodera trifolii]|uniref:Uncharacterized protein n=1 Tax=Heterodera trifolii TaxID=157864 RepID=A0ABD2ILC7_9BILA